MRTRNVLACQVLIASAAAAPALSQVPVWQFDNLGSTVNLRTFALADNGANGFFPAGPQGLDNQTVTAFTTGVIGPGGVASDWGAEAISLVSDDVLPPLVAPPGSFLSTGAGGVVTINGIGTPTLTVFFRTATSFDMFNADGYLGDAFADLVASLRFQIARNGAAVGNYTLAWTWSYFSFADPQPEAGLDDRALSRGLMSINTGNAFTLFNESFGPPNALFGSGNGNGGDAVAVLAGGSGPILIDINSRTEGGILPLPNFGAVPEDGHGSEFFATLTIQIVPAPGAGAALVIGLLGAQRRRRR